MDSIQTQLHNVPQTSRHTKVLFSDTISSGSLVAAKTFDIELPTNAIIVSTNVYVTTAFNTGTSAEIKFGDTATADKFLAATSIKTAAITASPAAKSMLNIAADTTGVESRYIVRATIDSVGTVPTAGALYWWVDYRFDANTVYDREQELADAS